jgi:superfamily I DNA/RNA helicase
LATGQKPRLIRLDGPPGSGKTCFLAQEAYRLSLETLPQDGLLKGSSTTSAANAHPLTSSILILCANRLNEARLRYELRLARQREGDQAGFRKIRLRQRDQWLFAQLNQALNSPEGGQAAEILEAQEAIVLLSRLLRDIVPIEHPLGYAVRQPGTALTLWRELQTPIQEADAQAFQNPILLDVLEAFEAKTTKANLFRRNQLAGILHEHLLAQPQKAALLRENCFSILIDEAQELSVEQHDLFAFLGCPLTLAGNSSLSIQGYQGACPERFASLAGYENFACESLPPDKPQEVATRQLWHFIQGTLLEKSSNESLSPVPLELPNALSLKAWRASDILAELERLATDLAHFVATAQIKGRPARYGDCAILLRSAQHLPVLLEVLKRQNIPAQAFQETQNPAPELTEAIISFYRLLAGWAADGLSAPTPSGKKETIEEEEAQQWEKRLFKVIEDDSLPPSWLDDFTRWQSLASLSFLRKASAAYSQNSDWLVLWPEAMSALLTPSGDPVGTEALTQFYQATERLQGYYQRTFQQPLSLTEWLAHAPTLSERFYLAPQAGNEENETENPAAVQILKVSQAQGEAFAWVAIPGLVTGDFPLIQQRVLASTDLSTLPHDSETRLLALGMSRARQVLRLSTHRQSLSGRGDGVTVDVQAAPCFEIFRRRTDGHFTLQEESASLPLSDNAISSNPVLALSGWGHLKPQGKDAPVLPAGVEPLILSPSGIKTFMTCPRQFYYSRLLRLPQERSPAATIGELIHSLMERFNRSYQPGNYTAERLSGLARELFALAHDRDKLEAAGYSERDWLRVDSLNELTLMEARQRFQASVEDLERKGFFVRYQTVKAIEAEVPLPRLNTAELPGCQIQGTADALMQFEDGSWEILDYKTYFRRFPASPARCQSHFENFALAALPDGPDISISERFSVKLHPDYPADYQLPLYFLAFNEDPRFRGRLRGAAIQLIRPQAPDKPEQGSIRLELTAQAIMESAPQLLADLQRYVVEPIQNSTSLAINLDSCEYCPYTAVCQEGRAFPEEAGAQQQETP